MFFPHYLQYFQFLSAADPNMRRQLSCVSPTPSAQTAFIECDICHVTCKNVRDLGLHKKEHHSVLFKPKPRQGPVSSVSKTLSPVPHGNVQKTRIGSPVLLPGQIACPLCKIGCNDKNVLMGHVSAEHVQYLSLIHI